jgi:hypothetical protein
MPYRQGAKGRRFEELTRWYASQLNSFTAWTSDLGQTEGGTKSGPFLLTRQFVGVSALGVSKPACPFVGCARSDVRRPATPLGLG